MLMGSDINPFESQETKPYKNDPRIAAMTSLVDTYQRDDIHGYEKVLQTNKDLLADKFIRENIDEVTRNMRTKAILKLVAPYTRFTLSFVSAQLKITLPEVQDILGFLIVDKRLRGRINQQDGTVEVESSSDMDRVTAVREWSSAIGSLWSTVLNESDGFRTEEGFVPPPGANWDSRASGKPSASGGRFRPGGKGKSSGGKLGGFGSK